MTSVLTATEALSAMPLEPRLNAPYPQPLNSGANAMCTFTLPKAGNASVSLWDALGRRCSTEQYASYEAGTHAVALPTTGLRPGVYFIRLQSGARIQLQRLMIR
jgi:hypothetical protein